MEQCKIAEVSAERLARALQLGRVRPVFQRIVEMPTARTVKVETLARWTEPDLGEISPVEFIPIAEANGLSRQLDVTMLDLACRELAKWRAGNHPDLAITVNMSPLTLAGDDLAVELLETIASHGLPVSSVWIEATESAMVGVAARHALEALSMAGVRIALDDFGTGFSSLSHLIELPVDAVKVDRSIVTDIEQPAASAIIRSLVRIGHELGIAVIAEGVETEVQERALRRLGVSLLQGFRFGRPLPAARVLPSMAAHSDGRRSRPPSTCPVAAARPANEEERLAALRALRILDTLPEVEFDHVTSIAAETFGTPMAMVSLVDADRQWFKSKVGTELSETSRDVSFCGHAILGTEVFVVEDALDDPRFAGSALVDGAPNIRFYAGAPLIDRKGRALGTLCIIDRSARRFDDSQRRLLSALAQQVVAQLELRAAAGELVDAIDRLTTIQHALEHQATHDDLTGLANRREFLHELEQRIDSAATAVVHIELDGFKQINDRFGHVAGDELLRRVAETLRLASTDGDVVARLGSDEFAMLVRADDAAALNVLTSRLRAAIRQPRCLGGDEVVLADATIGSARVRAGDTVESLLHRADSRMRGNLLSVSPR